MLPGDLLGDTWCNACMPNLQPRLAAWTAPGKEELSWAMINRVQLMCASNKISSFNIFYYYNTDVSNMGLQVGYVRESKEHEIGSCPYRAQEDWVSYFNLKVFSFPFSKIGIILFKSKVIYKKNEAIEVKLTCERMDTFFVNKWWNWNQKHDCAWLSAVSVTQW